MTIGSRTRASGARRPGGPRSRSSSGGPTRSRPGRSPRPRPSRWTPGAAAQELAILDMAQAEYTVTAMRCAGPAVLLALAAGRSWSTRRRPAYLTRLRRSGAWLDQIGERLRVGAPEGTAPGRSPRRASHHVGRGRPGRPGARTAPGPAPPPGWPGGPAWESQGGAVAAEVVKPALASGSPP